jgi:hypothetical protein
MRGSQLGDFAIFRAYAVLALQPHAKIHVSEAFLYPPPFLLFTVPVSQLPPAAGFAVWIGVAALGLALAARAAGLPWKAIGLGLISAPSLFCALTGQSGLLVSAILVVALGLAESAPVLSGLAAGMLIIKPQFGLLLPICYLATHNWRAIAAAVASAAGLILLTTLWFGPGIWDARHLANAQALLAAPWPSRFQIEMISPLVLFRSLHAGLALAAILQAIVSLAGAYACWRLWQSRLTSMQRLAPTLCLAALVTPYGYIYDLPALAMALAALALRRPERGLVPFTALQACTGIYAVLSVYLFSAGAICLAAILYLLWPSVEDEFLRQKIVER